MQVSAGVYSVSAAHTPSLQLHRRLLFHAHQLNGSPIPHSAGDTAPVASDTPIAGSAASPPPPPQHDQAASLWASGAANGGGGGANGGAAHAPPTRRVGGAAAAMSRPVDTLDGGGDGASGEQLSDDSSGSSRLPRAARGALLAVCVATALAGICVFVSCMRRCRARRAALDGAKPGDDDTPLTPPGGGGGGDSNAPTQLSLHGAPPAPWTLGFSPLHHLHHHHHHHHHHWHLPARGGAPPRPPPPAAAIAHSAASIAPIAFNDVFLDAYTSVPLGSMTHPPSRINVRTAAADAAENQPAENADDAAALAAPGRRRRRRRTRFLAVMQPELSEVPPQPCRGKVYGNGAAAGGEVQEGAESGDAGHDGGGSGGSDAGDDSAVMHVYVSEMPARFAPTKPAKLAHQATAGLPEIAAEIQELQMTGQRNGQMSNSSSAELQPASKTAVKAEKEHAGKAQEQSDYSTSAELLPAQLTAACQAVGAEHVNQQLPSGQTADVPESNVVLRSDPETYGADNELCATSSEAAEHVAAVQQGSHAQNQSQNGFGAADTVHPSARGTVQRTPDGAQGVAASYMS